MTGSAFSRQFTALNLYELGGFGAEERRESVDDLMRYCNRAARETDPSLKIDMP